MQTKLTPQDFIGQKFDKLTIIDAEHRQGKRQKIWYVTARCECGGTKTTQYGNLKHGNTTSCGCVKTGRKPTHGMIHTDEHMVWRTMRERCNNPNAANYYLYGGRGIKVCERWDKFENFYTDMGPRPSRKYTIDRIDSNDDYYPENCRWATSDEQARNKRNSVYIEIDGKRVLLIEECERKGLRYGVALKRLRLGWSPEKIFSTPIRPKKS